MAIERGALPSFNRSSEDRFRSPGSSALPRCVRFLQAAMLRAICGLLGCSIAIADESPTAIAEGTLHACTMLDIDRAIAVGDKGLVLRTEDGGKTWSMPIARGPHTYYAIGFDSAESLRDGPRNGIIVGGRIDGLTGRSYGVVELTNDDGNTWSRSMVAGLPRLLGLQRVGHRHWIAWGDWSDHWQSSFFETTDGGKSWNARPTPSGHLRCVAVDSAGRTMVIDRAGSLFFSPDGLDYQPVPLDIDPFRPLHFCRSCEQGWWVGGDHGQLFFSEDAVRWSKIQLPGNELDHALYQLRDAVIHGSKIWLVGEPGSAVWHSDDGGRKWVVSPTQHATVLRAIHALDDNVLVACGDSSRVELSRNGGNAWIECHRSGSRVACQAIASTQECVPWDALAYITHESQRRASAIIVHHQDLHGAMGHRPETSEKIMEAARHIGLDRVQMLTDFPVGDLRFGIRSTDLGYYQASDPNQSDLIRRLVLAIRCERPDLVIAEDTLSKHSLHAATAVATQQAIRLAASPNYRCFSPETGLSVPEWNVQRVLLRGTESGGLTFAPTMLLNSSSMLLSEVMQPVRFLVRDDSVNSRRSATKISYRLPTQRTIGIKHPLDGMILDRETRLIEKKWIKRKMTSLMAASNASLKVTQMLSTRGSGVWAESAWDDALMELAKDLPNEVLFQSLWTLALESRRNGNWHRWNSALNMIVEREGQGPMAELASRELMTYFGSPEVHRLVQDQWNAVESAGNDSSKTPSVAPTAQSSPFATGNPVSLASFDYSARVAAMARLRGTESFARFLGRWPDTWQMFRAEPEWAWLITARYRTRAILRGTPIEEIKDSIHWPPKHPGTPGWSHILSQEQSLHTEHVSASPIARIPLVASRPFLDGREDEDCWSHATSLELSSPWTEPGNTTRVLIARDTEFLYIHSRAGLRSTVPYSESKHYSESKNPSAPQRNGMRRRDALDSSKDHVRFRLDLDRDYCSWFELGWDIDGETLDQCNDMTWWNPEWFIAIDRTRESWSAEIAIPLATLLPDPSGPYPPRARTSPGSVTTAEAAENRGRDVEAINWTDQTWGIAFVRESPSSPMQSVPVCDADRWSCDRWLLVLPQETQPAKSVQSDPSVHLADPSSGFLDTKR